MLLDVASGLVPVGLRDPLEEARPRECVLLRTDRLDDVGREQRPDLSAALWPDTPREAGEVTGAEGVADARGIGLQLLVRAADDDGLRAALAPPARRPCRGW